LRARSTAACTRRVKGLQQIIDGIHVKGAHGVLIVGRRKNELRQCFLFVAARSGHASFIDEALNHRKAVEARHLHIEKDQIRVLFLDQIDGLDAIRPLPDNLDVAHRIEQILQLFARQLFVVDDECGDCHAIEI